jgi:TRAP transporter TAXI family solute receptor
MQLSKTTAVTAAAPAGRSRRQLAACVRLLHREGLLTYNGHVSTRVPGADAFLIHTLVDSRSNVAPERLAIVSFDGDVIDAPSDCRPPSEYPIHAEIYRARDDVGAVAHIHSEHAIAFTLVEGVTLRALRCDALDWADGVPVHADPTRIKTAEQGRALAATLGAGSAALMRAHGAVLVAPSVVEVFKVCVQFEENARAVAREPPRQDRAADRCRARGTPQVPPAGVSRALRAEDLALLRLSGTCGWHNSRGLGRGPVMSIMASRIAACIALTMLAALTHAQPPYNLTLSGASPGGLWSLLGAGVHASMAAQFPGSAVTYQTSGGGLANVMLVSAGRADLGMIHNVELRYALEGRPPFRQQITNLREIAYLYDWAPVQWVVSTSFADRYGIETVDDLIAARAPVRIGVNTRGNMVQELNRALFEAYGVTYEDIESWGGQVVYAASNEMAELMANRRLDMTGNSLFAPAASIVQVSQSLDVTMLSFNADVVAAVVENMGAIPYTIPAGTYDWLDHDVLTVSPGAGLVASESMPEQTAYDVTKAVVENLERIQRVHTAMRALTAEQMASQDTIPYHPGALRYYREAGLVD